MQRSWVIDKADSELAAIGAVIAAGHTGQSQQLLSDELNGSGQGCSRVGSHKTPTAACTRTSTDL